MSHSITRFRFARLRYFGPSRSTIISMDCVKYWYTNCFEAPVTQCMNTEQMIRVEPILGYTLIFDPNSRAFSK